MPDPDVVEIGPEWDPAAHDYGTPLTEEGRHCALVFGIGTLVALAVPAVLVLGPVVGGVLAGPAAPTLVTAGNLMLVLPAGTTLTATQQAIVNVLNNAGVWGQGANVLNMIVGTWGFRMLSLAGLMSLLGYNTANANVNNNPPTAFGNYPYYGGGDQTPPGFPGFPGYFPGQGAGAWACYILDGMRFCFFTAN